MKNRFNNINFKYNSIIGFISVIIPVYKDPEGIRDTLESLNEQSLNKSNFEIIVVNDGGDIKTEKICQEFKVKIITIIPNKGSYNARNKALEVSRGEFIAFVDSDIKVCKDWLIKGKELLENYDYLGGKVEIDKKKLKTLAHYFEYISAFNNERKLENYNYIPTANLFVKRIIISEIGGFDFRLFSGGDFEFGNRVYNSKKFKMHYDENILVIHPPRGQKNLLKKMIRVNKGVRDIYKFYPHRFPQFKKSNLKIIKAFLYPIFIVITNKKTLSFFIKFKLFFWSIWFGFLRLKYLHKNN